MFDPRTFVRSDWKNGEATKRRKSRAAVRVMLAPPLGASRTAKANVHRDGDMRRIWVDELTQRHDPNFWIRYMLRNTFEYHEAVADILRSGCVTVKWLGGVLASSTARTVRKILTGPFLPHSSSIGLALTFPSSCHYKPRRLLSERIVSVDKGEETTSTTSLSDTSILNSGGRSVDHWRIQRRV